MLYNDRIALKFAVEMPVKCLSDRKRFKPKYRGFETSRNLAVRRLTAYKMQTVDG